MRYEIILSGVGGQGLISIGDIIGQAACIEGRQVALTTSYGSEARGTFTKAEVIVSDEEIPFPGISEPTYLLCLAQVAYREYLGSLTKDTVVFYDASEVAPDFTLPARHIGSDYRELALGLGNLAVANTIALGSMVSGIGMLKQESVVQAVSNRFAGKDAVIALNLKAFELGLSIRQSA